MLAASNRALVADEARFLLLTGDQVYADEPPCLSVHGSTGKNQSCWVYRPRRSAGATTSCTAAAGPCPVSCAWAPSAPAT